MLRLTIEFIVAFILFLSKQIIDDNLVNVVFVPCKGFYIDLGLFAIYLQHL